MAENGAEKRSAEGAKLRLACHVDMPEYLRIVSSHTT
jgi:hypothetical protein